MANSIDYSSIAKIVVIVLSWSLARAILQYWIEKTVDYFKGGSPSVRNYLYFKRSSSETAWVLSRIFFLDKLIFKQQVSSAKDMFAHYFSEHYLKEAGVIPLAEDALRDLYASRQNLPLFDFIFLVRLEEEGRKFLKRRTEETLDSDQVGRITHIFDNLFKFVYAPELEDQFREFKKHVKVE